MANPSQGRCRPVRPAQAVQTVRSSAAQEPPVRRWPHPVGCQDPPLPPEPTLHYIRCALSYQNQLLSEIKTLLQQLAEQGRES
jgi:hypothetical protein